MIQITVNDEGHIVLVREDDEELKEGIDYDVLYEGEPVEGVDMDQKTGTAHKDFPVF